MKYTGIVRRLDSLGRIVIPREYRKMHKIQESDPLEITATESGEIIIKKVDLSAELISSGEEFVKQLFDASGLSVMLTDKEKFLFGAGSVKNMLTDKPISQKLKSLIESRKGLNGAGSELGLENGFIAVYPIYSGDVFGSLCLFSTDTISEENEKLLKTLAKILGGIMQRY